jgi:hypothetical protein
VRKLIFIVKDEFRTSSHGLRLNRFELVAVGQ